ncbi:MAG: hypothetical protein KGD59_14770 [Candidatus Heimdallarchaeota archaeon]|nr:hypothetical protein [Candidatus Heimdallarchaeota archaeon]MBY8995811.1 hypothetical protein [Candidatus Heimdallarchaeota archaeon]
MKIPEIYADKNVVLSMAGSGNPWDYFIPSSKLTLRAIHDGYSLAEIQELFQISEEDLFEKINLLMEANLLRKDNGNYYPTFLIADEKETLATYNHSKKFGRIIADELVNNWEEIKSKYKELEISKTHSINDLSLVLVGSKILDIGLLEALVKDRTLLTPAPKRPSPKRPDGQYYFFMIDGKVEYLGKYGEDSKDLPWENWHFFTFGLNIINEKYNEPRGRIEERYDELRKNEEVKKPEELALKLGVPILSREDSLVWKEFTQKVANRLLLRIKEKEKDLLEFYNNLKISRYTSNSLGEFMCWYIHIAYSWAIDFLVEEKIIYMPDEKFGTLVIYSEGPQGLLIK